MIGPPGTTAADWAAVQALLERNGVGSAVVVPRGAGWQETLRLVADSVLNRWALKSRPVVAMTFGSSLDSLLLATPVGHALRTHRLAAVAPGRPQPTGLRRWLARLPTAIRPAPNEADPRLAAWAAPVLVLRARDDDGFNATDAVRLADATGQARVAVLPGGGFANAPQHPADDDWREVIEFVLGRARYYDAVVQPDSVVTRDTVLELPTVLPNRATPSVQRPR